MEVQKSSKDGTSGVKFEKTLAAQIEKALAKEFTDADHGGAGVLGEGAGRSFNQTADSEGAVLETVVRVSRTGGGKNREVREGTTSTLHPSQQLGVTQLSLMTLSLRGLSRSLSESGQLRKT